MVKVTPAEFVRQIRQEVLKVTWPTRKETLVSTGMVFLMVVLAGVFFMFADWGIGAIIRLLLGLGG